MLLASLRTDGPMADGRDGAAVASSLGWQEALLEGFRNVRLYRRRLHRCVDSPPSTRARADRGGDLDARCGRGGPLDAGRSKRCRAAPDALGGDADRLPGPASVPAHGRRLGERARRAEADGSAKHWEFVAAREAQRRLASGSTSSSTVPCACCGACCAVAPARLGQGPPIRASERGPESWD